MSFLKSLYSKHFQKKVYFCEDFEDNVMKPSGFFGLFMKAFPKFQSIILVRIVYFKENERALQLE